MNETNETQEKQTNELEEKSNIDNQPQEQLPMNFYNLVTNFLLPCGIVINSIGIFGNFISLNMLAMIINIGWLAFLIFLRKCMIERKKDTFTYIVIYLVVISVSSFINTIDGESDIELPYIIGVILGISTFAVPEYIYFKKRKHIFIN